MGDKQNQTKLTAQQYVATGLDLTYSLYDDELRLCFKWRKKLILQKQMTTIWTVGRQYKDFLHKQDVKKQDVRKTGYISDQQTK